MCHADVSHVEDWLYVGAQPKRGERLPDGIRTVLSLRGECPPERIYNDLVETSLWRPLVDEGWPGREWLELTVDLILLFRRRVKPVLVHCWFGVSRGPMVAAACLMRANNLTAKVAVEKITHARPRTCLNAAFVAGLAAFERLP